jgi:hypothetical protein
MPFYKVKEDPNLVRDSETNCILNVDRNAIFKHEMIIKEVGRKKRIDEELNSIKEDISELKNLLKMALSRENR